MKKTVLWIVALGLAISSQAQKVILEDGNLDFLKGQKDLKVEYDYSNMAVGKYDKEKDYTDDKVAEYNAKEKGKGDKWLVAWNNDRKTDFQPKFEELLNKTLEDLSIVALPSKAAAKYTLTLHTTFTEPGFNVGVVRKNASINVEYIFTETGHPGKILAKLSARNVPGRDFGGYDFDAGARIGEAYAKAGKSLGQFIVKKLK